VNRTVLRAASALLEKDIEGPAQVQIEDGRIVAAGPADDAAVPAGAEVIDLGDRFICPGFVDVHAHFEVAARTWHTTVDCRAPACADVDEVVETLREAARDHDPDRWMVGQGNLFFDRKLADRRLPSKDDLDRASRDVPIAVRAGGHISVLNSRALEFAGIDRDYDPGSHSVTGLPVVERDSNGDPTGVVKEMDNLLSLPDRDLSGDALRDALREGAKELFTRHGVTTVGEISETVEGLETMDALIADGEMGLSIATYLWAPGTLSVDEACEWRERFSFRSPSDRMWIQGLKLFADGGFTAAGAAVKRPYAVEPYGCGHLAFSPEDFSAAIRRAAEAGLQLAVHANGERAQELVCHELAANPELPWRLRPRIEHAGNFVPDWSLTELWRKAGIIAVPQPIFLYVVADFMPDYVGDYGHSGQLHLRRLIDDGWELSTSSDVWVGSEQRQTNPLMSIWCCAARTSFLGTRIEPEQAISVDEALRMATIGGARVMGLDHDRGSLAAGKRADVIVLDRDPRAVPVDDIPNLSVDLVFVGGRLVHERDGGDRREATARA
jgi:predicted amidohydrolase YtcJ